MSKRLTVTVSDNTFQAIQEAGKISRRAPATEAGHFLDNHYEKVSSVALETNTEGEGHEA